MSTEYTVISVIWL